MNQWLGDVQTTERKNCNVCNKQLDAGERSKQIQNILRIIVREYKNQCKSCLKKLWIFPSFTVRKSLLISKNYFDGLVKCVNNIFNKRNNFFKPKEKHKSK